MPVVRLEAIRSSAVVRGLCCNRPNNNTLAYQATVQPSHESDHDARDATGPAAVRVMMPSPHDTEHLSLFKSPNEGWLKATRRVRHTITSFCLTGLVALP